MMDAIANAPLLLKRTTQYFGFVLERQNDPIKQFPPELLAPAQRALAEAMARFEAQHKDIFKNRDVVDEVRELYRRSGAQTTKLGFAELSDVYAEKLAAQNVSSLLEFRNANLKLHVDDFVPPDVRETLWALPEKATIADREVEIVYDLDEEENIAVARLRLPEKLARTISEDDLPTLDRPLRFIVSRGSRGALRADTLEMLQTLLEGPWTPTEKHEHRARPKKKKWCNQVANQKPKSAKVARANSVHAAPKGRKNGANFNPNCYLSIQT